MFNIFKYVSLLAPLTVDIVRQVETLCQGKSSQEKLDAAVGLARTAGVVTQVADPNIAESVGQVEAALPHAINTTVALLNATGVLKHAPVASEPTPGPQVVARPEVAPAPETVTMQLTADEVTMLTAYRQEKAAKAAAASGQ